jgi:hypothetical protein
MPVTPVIPVMRTLRASVLVLGALAFAAGAVACGEEEPVNKPPIADGPGGNNPSHAQVAGKPDLVVKDAEQELKRTKVIGTLDSAHAPGTSLVWCSTLGLAWNELGPALGGDEDLTLGSPNELAGKLNDSPVSKADLDDESYVALGGLGRDNILQKINAELTRKFKGAASPSVLPSELDPDDVLAYAYLFKNLEFETPFLKRERPLEFGAAPGAGQPGAKVGAFGLWSDSRTHDRDAIEKQISVISYASPELWACELKSKATDDRLIIARLAPKETLAKTVEAMLEMKSPEPLAFEHADTLVVPYANFDITRSYSELEGLEVSTPSQSARIKKALQNIRLKLDERGAVLKSDAAVIGVTSALVTRDPKRMICDGPFLVVMMRKDAKNPYFAMWVDNPEVLVAFK